MKITRTSCGNLKVRCYERLGTSNTVGYNLPREEIVYGGGVLGNILTDVEK